MKKDIIDINDPTVVSVKYWHKLEDGRIQCDLCPRFCKLKDGQRGLCYIRTRVGDMMYLTSYGRSSGYCIDPIEKKPLSHFLPGTPVLSFGTAGCNLACKFCQNWDMSKARDMDKLMDQALPDDIAYTAKQYHCKSVAYTYNDPVIFHEYAVDVAKACKQHGVKSVAVSAGYISKEARPEFFEYMDAANIDLKAFNEDFYWKLCGAHLQDVLDTIIYIKHNTNIWLELTTLIIPDENDCPKEIEAMSKWILDNLGPDVPIHFTAFHPDYKMQNKNHTSRNTLKKARTIAMSAGLNYVYTGNIHDEKGASTYCTNCGKVVIGREWHIITDWQLNDSGCCLYCGTQCAGVFDGPPGNWGQKRLPIRLHKAKN